MRHLVLALAASSLATSQRFNSIEGRYTARTSCADAWSNQNEPTIRFHCG